MVDGEKSGVDSGVEGKHTGRRGSVGLLSVNTVGHPV